MPAEAQPPTRSAPVSTERALTVAVKSYAGRDGEIRVTGCPGLALRVRASGRASWVLRAVLADKGQQRITIGPRPGLDLAEARRRGLELLAPIAGGSDPRPSASETLKSQTIVDAHAAYLDACAAELSPKTVYQYRLDLGRFVRWTAANGIERLDQLTADVLGRYRDSLVGAPQQLPVRGGKRASRAVLPASQPISARRANGIMTATKTWLNRERARGKLTALDRDGIEDTLKNLRVKREMPVCMSPDQLRSLLAAAIRHDSDTFTLTRAEHVGQQPPGSTLRFESVAPYLAVSLLTGMRQAESLGLLWADLKLDALGADGKIVGEIHLPATRTKTGRGRVIGLEVSPACRDLLVTLRMRATDDRVFAGLTVDVLTKARARLVKDYGAESFKWKDARSTCAAFLNSSAVYGRASHVLAAQQLGHGVGVAEKHYLASLRGIASTARTLEQAMGVEPEIASVIAAATTPASRSNVLTLGKRS